MAPEVQTVEAPQATEILESMTFTERQNWEKTGQVPEKPKTEESATSIETPASEAKPEPEKKAEVAPAPDPGKTAQEPEKGKEHISRADRRISELLAERQTLRKELAELKGAKEPLKAAPPAESAPAKPSAKTVIPEALKAKMLALVEQADQFETYEEMVTALGLEVVQTMTPEIVKQVLKQEAEAKELAKVKETRADSFFKTVKESASKHEDWTKVTDTPLMAELIPVDSPLNALIVESPLGGEVLYHLGLHHDEIERISALGPIAQAREVFKIEQSLSGSTPAPVLTEAPPPPRDVGTGEISQADPIAKALQDKDYKTYERLANEREMKKKSP